MDDEFCKGIVHDLLKELDIEPKTDIQLTFFENGFIAEVGIFDDLAIVIESNLGELDFDIKHCHGFYEDGGMILLDCVYVYITIDQHNIKSLNFLVDGCEHSKKEYSISLEEK